MDLSEKDYLSYLVMQGKITLKEMIKVLNDEIELRDILGI